MQFAFERAVGDFWQVRRQWNRCTSPAHVYLITLRELGWTPTSARQVSTAQGEVVDLLSLSPVMVSSLAQRDAGHWADKRALLLRPQLNGVWCRPVLWEGTRDLLKDGCSQVWGQHHKACVRNAFALGSCTQARLKDHGLADDDICQLCQASKGTLFHGRFECEAFDGDRRQYLSAA
eukprot:1708115-Pyramimonas_sp.AAC.1